jgi:short-subunit dehydrogenase
MILSNDPTSRKPICLITGATEGVGEATAAALESKGFTVVLAVRDAVKADAVKAEIKADTNAIAHHSSDTRILVWRLVPEMSVRVDENGFAAF